MAKAKKKAAKKASAEAPKRPQGPASGMRSTGGGKARIETKLSTKMIVGAVVFPEDAEDGYEMDLYTVYGEASGTKVGESTFGEWTALTGRFRAIRALDGKLFQAQKAFLPNVAREIAVETLNELQKRAKQAEASGQPVSSAALEFAIKVGARKDSSINVGYRYTCEPLVQEQSDLFARLESNLPLLAGPSK